MALNAIAFNAMFDTLRPNSIHGFDETGNLKEFVANEPLFVYEGGGGLKERLLASPLSIY